MRDTEMTTNRERAEKIFGMRSMFMDTNAGQEFIVAKIEQALDEAVRDAKCCEPPIYHQNQVDHLRSISRKEGTLKGLEMAGKMADMHTPYCEDRTECAEMIGNAIRAKAKELEK